MKIKISNLKNSVILELSGESILEKLLELISDNLNGNVTKMELLPYHQIIDLTNKSEKINKLGIINNVHLKIYLENVKQQPCFVNSMDTQKIYRCDGGDIRENMDKYTKEQYLTQLKKSEKYKTKS
jgi:hypothetical protein